MEEKLPFNLPEFKVEELRQDDTDLGTFKSVKTLKDAYDSLRSCFTKNAMELAQIKKSLNSSEIENEKSIQNQEKDNKTDIIDGENLKNTENLEKSEDLNGLRTEITKVDEIHSIEKQQNIQENISDKDEKSPDNSISDKTINVPENTKTENVWDKEDWNSRVDKFFVKYPSAKTFSKDIAEILVNDKEIRASEAPLSNAWIKILQKNQQNYEVSDDFLIKKVLSNKKICDVVISDYLNKVKTNKTAPSVIANAEGAKVSAELHTKVFDMSEAKQLAKKLFK